jgi:hypothetical protein
MMGRSLSAGRDGLHCSHKIRQTPFAEVLGARGTISVAALTKGRFEARKGKERCVPALPLPLEAYHTALSQERTKSFISVPRSSIRRIVYRPRTRETDKTS